ncbi:uncharacterized protein LOC134688391 [Mytilus trossulus]|uniref:uncharacterized protein LOC134688391 n=1 Tax=Mytilus trossulus TaxID=6551 RepID=UPI003005ACAC
MESNTIYISGGDIDEQLETEILEIYTSGPNASVIINADIEDNQKRWLIIGICIQSVLAPALRKFTEPITHNLYNVIQSTHLIQTQTYPNQLRKYPSSGRDLNYEAINNNHLIPRVRRQPDVGKYDYKVSSHVEFSKLFLKTFMAQYTAFDETCDLSALLGIIINIDKFPQPVQNVAMKLRSDVRNPWAHCNFDEWDSLKYQTAFQLLHQLVRCLQLNTTDEASLLAELTKWETNGFMFLQGYGVTQQVVKEIRQQTRALADYALKMKSGTDSIFAQVHAAMFKINGEIMLACSRISSIESKQNEQKTDISNLNKEVSVLYDRSLAIENVQTEQGLKIEANVSNTAAIAKNVEMLKIRDDSTAKHVSELENENKKIREDISDIKSDITEIKVDIKDFTNYLPMSKPVGKTLFYPPNRPESFVARETELCKLKDSCIGKNNANHTLVICGLGGCGKTTLAIEFAWRSQEFYPAGVFWMSAETQDTLEDSLTILALDVDSTGKDFRETLKKTLKWFSNLNERWLLVVDNIDEEYLSDNTKELLLGSWKRSTRGHIIITSRREPNEVEESMVVKKEDCITLNVFEIEEGLEFLKRRTGINCTNDDDTIMTLVEELGGLPLALEQAAAHIKSIKCAFSEYVNKFKKKRLKLLKAAPSVRKISRDRLAIATTWQLNIDYITRQSENEGLGMAAATVMHIASFLFADDIPKELVNVGSPLVEDSNLVEVLEDEMGCKQVIEILTRFSLFQRVHDTSLSVHRLVQEVIRDNMSVEHCYLILQHATRMVNNALYFSLSPADILYSDALKKKSERGTLVKWSKLAANANSIKHYVFNLKKDEIPEHELFFNKEILRILQTTALYHSIHQRQAIALADQAQMIRIMTTVEVDTHFYNDLTRIKIPLLQRDREKIVDCLMSVVPVEIETPDYTSVVTYRAEDLRLLGNEAFKEQRYLDAIRYYTEGIRSSSIETIDSRLFSNRCLAYIRIRDFVHAFSDANKCIEIASINWKGYCWKAYAISGLIEEGSFPPTMEAMGLASACIASYKYPPCLLEYNMKISYPIINYQIVERPECLQQDIMSLTDRPFTTLLLRKGLYTFNEPLITTKSIQVIGIEDDVDIDTGPGLQICRLPKGAFPVDIEPEQTIKTHFEKVNFVSGNHITVLENSIATFYNCKFSNGKAGCDTFPKCTGKIGCINPLKCRQAYKEDKLLFGTISFGQAGFPGIMVFNGGIAYLDACLLNRCGGGGVLSEGKGSFMEIKNCNVQNMRQMGIEARNEGAVKISKNTILENQTHGIAIGPNGYGFIEENIIQGNGAEGIWCGGVLDSHESPKMNETGASRAVIIDNDIGQNGLCGVSCDGCFVEIKGNRIFSNHLWGTMVKSRSSAYILNNDIFDNKCGGIRIGHNYTASVIIDGNTIRDHTGPGVYTVNSAERFLNKMKTDLSDCFVGNGEIMGYSRPPVITSTNVLRNNDKGTQHPNEVVRLIEACSYCRQVLHNLKSCSKCKKATYCSRKCQSKHWLLHKHMCKLLRSSYVVEVPMSNIESNMLGDEPNTLHFRQFNPKLKGILEGTPPNKRSCNRFIVKIQSGKEYTFYDPNKELVVYDQTVTLDIQFSNPILYHLCMECGVLAGEKFTTKKIFCWASYKNNGKTLCFYTDNLPPFQTW